MEDHHSKDQYDGGNTATSWSSHSIMDMLSHHIAPEIRAYSDAFACRTVCRTWRDAFGIPFARISPRELHDPDIFQRISATCKRFLVSRADAAELAQFFSVMRRNSNIESIEISYHGTENIDIECAKVICDILRLDLQRLTEIIISSARELDPDVSREIFKALQETKSPLKTISFPWCKLGYAGGAAAFSAFRGSRTVEKLSLGGCSLTESIQSDLIDFIQFNTSVRILKIQYNWADVIDSNHAQEFSRALRTNTTLQVLDMSYSTTHNIAPIFSALRTNKTLRSLKLNQSSMFGDDVPLIFNCLCQSRGLQRLDITLTHSDEAPVILRRFFKTNQTLKRLQFQMDDSKSVDFAPMFDGLAQNTTLTHLGFSHVSSTFVEQLGDCIKNPFYSALPLQRIYLGYTDMGESALNLIEALHHLPTLRTVEMPVCPIGPRSVEALAILIQSHTSLEALHIYKSGIDDAGALRLIEALRKNSTLLEIGIGGDDYSVPVFEAVCDYISTNRSLEYLDMSGTSIPAELRPRIEDALLRNMKMQRFNCTFVKGESMIHLELKEYLQRRGYSNEKLSQSSH